MKIKLAPSLLLTVLSGSGDGVVAFSASRPAVTSRAPTSDATASHRRVGLSMSNDVDADCQNVEPSELSRRNALSRLAATAAASAAFLGGTSPAFAEKPPTEFSESGVSEASVLRKPPPAEEAAPEAAPAEAPAEAPEAKSSSDFDGNEAGSVGAGDEGSQPSDKTVGVPILDLPNAYDDPKVLGAAGAAVAVLGLASLNTAGEPEYDDENPAPWKLDLPTPYGIQNAENKNPFITEVLEYCEGGKVTEPCAETIKDFLDDIAETGAVASPEEAKAIAGYLDSLGSNSPGSGGKAGAAFASYLDALSEGSAPPPSSAKAVKTYLDTLKGTEGGAPKPKWKPMKSPIVAAAPAQPAPEPIPEPTPEPEPVPVAPTPDFSEYDTRLTSIEGRVSSLETKVDRIPDQVFAKIEAWQTSHEERLSEEVRKIVEALTPPPAPPAPVVVAPPPAPVVVPAPAPVALAPVPVPAPAQPVAPVVQASPLSGAIPPRPGVPRAGESAAPKRGYGIGGGAPWKNVSP